MLIVNSHLPKLYYLNLFVSFLQFNYMKVIFIAISKYIPLVREKSPK